MTESTDWEKSRVRFCDLGGTAENVRLAEGRVGRGLFAFDPRKPTLK